MRLFDAGLSVVRKVDFIRMERRSGRAVCCAAESTNRCSVVESIDRCRCTASSLVSFEMSRLVIRYMSTTGSHTVIRFDTVEINVRSKADGMASLI